MIGLLRATFDKRERKEDKEEVGVTYEMLKQTGFISRDNELDVWRAIDTLVGDKLKEYPTSVMEDKKLLKETLS